MLLLAPPVRALLGLATITALALQASAGAACVRQTTWSVVDSTTPSASSVDVPLNAPILVRFTASTYDPAMPGATPPGYSEPRAILTSSGGTARVPLHQLLLERYDGQSPQGIGPKLSAFVPDAALSPSTQYTVELGENTELPAPNVNPPTTWTFTTGVAPQAPLYFEGSFSATFEPGTDPHMVCEIPLQTLCGGPACTQQGNDDVTKARIILPAAVGGYANEF
jgi:hypothetical protein